MILSIALSALETTFSVFKSTLSIMAYHSFLDPDGKHLGFKEKMVEKEKSSTTLTLN